MRKQKAVLTVTGIILSLSLMAACSAPAETDGDITSSTDTTSTAASSSTGSVGADPDGTTESGPASSDAASGLTGSTPSQPSYSSTAASKPQGGSNAGTGGGSVSSNTGSPGNSGGAGNTGGNTGSQATPSAPPSTPTEHKAGKGDEQAVADKVLEYINQFRREGGVPAATKLPGLTEYAEYRSRQLVTNFAHDTRAEREAATALKYGEYIIPSEWGMTGEPYYTAHAGEAIGNSGISGSIDTVAKVLASALRESSGHWSYVGENSTNKYIAVGVSFEKGTWYCCVCVTDQNTDLL